MKVGNGGGVASLSYMRMHSSLSEPMCLCPLSAAPPLEVSIIVDTLVSTLHGDPRLFHSLFLLAHTSYAFFSFSQCLSHHIYFGGGGADAVAGARSSHL